jgi:polygalacturonase
LGERFVVTDYGVKQDSTLLQTQALQAVIDRAAESGGVVVIPKGVFLSGALFFKQGTHLHLERGAVLKGSDDIYNFPIVMTRIEGQTLKYFAALVNADNVDGFTISGEGTIDGNGLRYWRAFWLRRQFNPQCTNMDEMRPRLVYISNAKNVRLEGITLRNSPYWTCHIYRTERIQIDGVHFFAPSSPVKAPSSDAIDLDVCHDVLVKNCYLSVNDDAISLKGGKGPWADQDPNNGDNQRIIIEDCTFGFCHSCLTCGSESIHNRNIILRRIQVDKADRLLWLKMRPDTPQNYEYITVEEISGNVTSFLFVHPWTQFFDLKGRKDVPMSYGSHIVMRNIELECKTFFNVKRADDQYRLSDFTFENLVIKAQNAECDRTQIDRFEWSNVKVN